jgi:mRNA interferase MazF
VKRGDLVVAAAPGAYGKPRPHLVVQADVFMAHPSVTLLLITSELTAAPLCRVTVDPSDTNGLRAISQIALDKAVTLPADKITNVIGQLDVDTMVRVTRGLAVWLGIA